MIKQKELFKDERYTFISETSSSNFKNVRIKNCNGDYIYNISRAIPDNMPIIIRKFKKGKHTFYRVDLYGDELKSLQYTVIFVPMSINNISPVYNDNAFYDIKTTDILIRVSGAYFNIDRISKAKDNIGTVDMTYEQFAELCRSLKNKGVEVGRITSYNSSIPSICTLETFGNVSNIYVKVLIENVRLGYGTISNPSVLKRWPGFKK